MWKNKSVATDCALHTPYYLMISRLEDGLGIGGGFNGVYKEGVL